MTDDHTGIWREAHEIAEEELPRIKSGFCMQPGLAAILANFAVKRTVELEREIDRLNDHLDSVHYCNCETREGTTK